MNGSTWLKLSLVLLVVALAVGATWGSVELSKALREAWLEQARATLASDLETARDQMRSHAQELARSAAEQILGRSLS